MACNNIIYHKLYHSGRTARPPRNCSALYHQWSWDWKASPGVALMSGQHGKCRGTSIHSSFVLLQTLTPDLQKQQKWRRDGSGTFTEMARLRWCGLIRAPTLTCDRSAHRRVPTVKFIGMFGCHVFRDPLIISLYVMI